MAENGTRWYAVHTISGKENKVKDSIEQELQSNDSLLKPYITQVKSPCEKILKQSADGKKKTEKDKILFPGYVFIEAMYTKELPSLMRDNIPYVLGFMGNVATKEPGPLSEAEVRRLLGYETNQMVLEDSEISFQKGETVKVISDPFNGFSGVIDDVDDEKKKLKVMVKIFGRDTTVELSFSQVEGE